MHIPIFEYDPSKSRRNHERHGIDFERAQELWMSSHVVLPARSLKGERRWGIIGEIEHKLFVAIFTYRGEDVRIITCHRADGRLQRVYERGIHGKKEN